MIAKFLALLLQMLVPAIVKKSKDTAEDSREKPELKRKLQAQIRAHWLILMLVLFCCSGCFTRTIYVADGTPVRLRQNVKAVKVWVKDSEGIPVKSKMDLVEGWYCLPLKDLDHED